MLSSAFFQTVELCFTFFCEVGALPRHLCAFATPAPKAGAIARLRSRPAACKKRQQEHAGERNHKTLPAGLWGADVESIYIISKCGSGWVIAADGAMLLICESEAIARQTVQDAVANYREAGGMRGGLNRVAEARALGANGRKPPASTAA